VPRRIFPAGTVTNTTGAPLRLEFYPTSTSIRRETDLWTIDDSNNLLERIPNGVVIADTAGAYSAFAGPDDLDTLYALPSNTTSRTALTGSSSNIPGAAASTWATPAASTTLTGTLAAWTVTSVDCTTGTGARTLPAASSVPSGTAVSAKKADTSPNTLVVSRAGSDKIYGTGTGANSKTLSLAGEAVEFVSNGVDKWTIRATDTPSGVLASTYATRLAARRLLPVSPVFTPPAAMTSPPTVALTKSQGASVISSVAAGGSGYAINDTITLTGGTFSVATVLKVLTLSGSAVATASIVVPGLYTVNPTNAVAQGSSSGGGTGATFNLVYSQGAASSVTSGTTVGPTDTRYRFTGNGPSNLSSSGFYGNTTQNSTHTSWEWSTDALNFDIKMIGLSSAVVLFVDGVRVDTTGASTDASGSQYRYTVTFGTAVPRNFRLYGFNGAFGGVILPATATLWAPTQGRRPLAWGMGDSYMLGTGATVNSTNAFSTMCTLLGMEFLADGRSGTGWTSTSGDLPATRATSKLGALTQTTVDYVFLDLGYNDAGGNMTTVATNFAAAVAAIRATTQGANARIIVFGPATPLGTTANLTTVKTTLSTAATTAGVDFIDVDNWVSSSNSSVYTGGDNVHPNQTGHDYIGVRKAQAVHALLAS
jgi:lysophospholipase L1-like esterase